MPFQSSRSLGCVYTVVVSGLTCLANLCARKKSLLARRGGLCPLRIGPGGVAVPKAGDLMRHRCRR